MFRGDFSCCTSWESACCRSSPAVRLSRKGNGVYKVVPVGGEGKNSGDQMSLFYACLQWESNPSGQVLLLYDAGLDERAARDCEELARGAGVRFVRSPEELAELLR